MEMNGEKILKKAKKTLLGIKIAYIIVILAIIISSVSITYRQENEKPEPIDFTTEGAIGMQTDQYAFLKVEGLTEEVAIYGNTENEYDSTNDRYYIAVSDGYLYVVDLNFEIIEQLKAIQEYFYSEDENAVPPEPVTIYGMTEEIPKELKEMIVDYYNKATTEENQITVDEFEMVFGSVLLNVRREAVDVTIENGIIIIGIVTLIIIIILHISLKVIGEKTKRYLKTYGYEPIIAEQLDDYVEEKHYKDKVIFTKDFFVDTQRGLVAFKYSDVKWIHVHTLKYLGVMTLSSNIVVHLKDGKTNFGCVEIRGKQSEEFIEIFNKLCSKIPEDALKGYTPENIQAFKEYKRELKK